MGLDCGGGSKGALTADTLEEPPPFKLKLVKVS